MWSEIPSVVWAGVIGVVSTAMGIVAGRNVTKADAASKLTDAAVQVVNELQEELVNVRARLKAVEDEVRDCEERYKELARRMN